jgi:hypothetical protein
MAQKILGLDMKSVVSEHKADTTAGDWRPQTHSLFHRPKHRVIDDAMTGRICRSLPVI